MCAERANALLVASHGLQRRCSGRRTQGGVRQAQCSGPGIYDRGSFSATASTSDCKWCVLEGLRAHRPPAEKDAFFSQIVTRKTHFNVVRKTGHASIQRVVLARPTVPSLKRLFIARPAELDSNVVTGSSRFKRLFFKTRRTWIRCRKTAGRDYNVVLARLTIRPLLEMVRTVDSLPAHRLPAEKDEFLRRSLPTTLRASRIQCYDSSTRKTGRTWFQCAYFKILQAACAHRLPAEKDV
ncbi:hypothetical protein DFH06DRAFT_1300963 [Mycena polygramma]|nr:hypothetical protein DFH06DRAFT_1300963 [Mycena polygramma]